jgi:hypothetical protein
LLDLNRILSNNRTCFALTGLSISAFNTLLQTFERELYLIRKLKPNRKCAVGVGQKGSLPTTADKLAFTLIYLKVYPTYDVLAALTYRSRGKCCESIQFLLPVLEKSLGKSCVLPERKITSVNEFFHQFSDIQDCFIDGVERPVQRPKSSKQQRKLYSGKKKSHTRKNIICCDDKRQVLFLSPTHSGRRHDKRVLDKSQFIENLPPDVTIWADTGFVGLQHQHNNTETPKKRQKGQKLSQEQKDNNKAISAIRVVIEHAIGGCKGYKAMADIYRNKRKNLDDLFHLLAAGLWNFHLQNV